MKFKNLNFETILKDAEHSFNFDYNSYIESYPEFIDYFKGISVVEKHHLIIGSHFVYGWMPTVLQLDTQEIEQVLFLLNAAKCGQMLDAGELKTIKKCINNSMVGLSKLLHFLNPRDYAIWDSHIFRYLTGSKSTYGIDNPALYLEYLQGLKEIAANKDYQTLHWLVARYFKYPIEPMRAIELVMFETQRSKSA